MSKDGFPEDTSNVILVFKEALQSTRELLIFESFTWFAFLTLYYYYYCCCCCFLLSIKLTNKSSFSSNDFKATYTGLFFKNFLNFFINLFWFLNCFCFFLLFYMMIVDCI